MDMRYVSIEQTIQFSICKISNINSAPHCVLFWSAGIPTMRVANGVNRRYQTPTTSNFIPHPNQSSPATLYVLPCQPLSLLIPTYISPFNSHPYSTNLNLHPPLHSSLISSWQPFIPHPYVFQSPTYPHPYLYSTPTQTSTTPFQPSPLPYQTPWLSN